MKKLTLVFLALIMVVFALVACDTVVPDVTGAAVNENGELILTFSDGTTQTVKEVDGMKPDDGAKPNDPADATFSFDENQNLILTYPDGTTVSLGKDALKEYTVTFVDHDGTPLATEKTYAGLGVTAPADPQREDYVFAGWDKTFASVTADMTVTATYTAKATYTVTFKDHDGTVLKTETVVSGKDATPPADPTRTDYNFTGWQGDYTGITKNTEITATYTEKGSYTVTFVDYNGLSLGTATVKEGATATAPATPTRDGYTFKGWSSALTNITANKTVTAQYTLVSAANVFDIAYKVSGDTVTLTLSLAGNVRLAGFEGSLAFTGMTASAVDKNSQNITVNLKGDGTVSFVYASEVNVTKGETVFTVTLTKTADAGKADITIIDCFDEAFNTITDYTVLGETIKLK